MNRSLSVCLRSFITEQLLVKVAEKMKRFDAHISTLDGSLQETPEIFHLVRVDVPIYVCFGVVDDFVFVIGKTFVGFQRIGVECRSGCYVLFHLSMDDVFLSGVDNTCSHRTVVTIQQAEHYSLSVWAAPVNLCSALSDVHVSRLAADEGFIRFDLSGHLVDASSVHRVPKALQHEPCGLLRDANSASDLVAAHSILAVGKQPHRAKPLVQSYRAVLENRADLNGELLFAVKALPHQARFEKREPFGLAAWTLRAVRPLSSRYRLKTYHRIGEMLDALHQVRWKDYGIVCHDYKIAPYG